MQKAIADIVFLMGTFVDDAEGPLSKTATIIIANFLPKLCSLSDSPFWEVRKLVADLLVYFCLAVEVDDATGEIIPGANANIVSDVTAALQQTAGNRAQGGLGPNIFRSLVRASSEVVDSRGIFGTVVGAQKKMGNVFRASPTRSAAVTAQPGTSPAASDKNASPGTHGTSNKLANFFKLKGPTSPTKSSKETRHDSSQGSGTADDSDRMSVYSTQVESLDMSAALRPIRSVFSSPDSDNDGRAPIEFLVGIVLAGRSRGKFRNLSLKRIHTCLTTAFGNDSY